MATLRTQGDIITEFLVRTNQSTTAGFLSDTMLGNWFSQAHSWAAAAYPWPMTEARYSTTSASLGSNEDGYTTLQYPEGFRADSIRLLTVGGKRFEKKNFYRFQSFLEDNSSDTSKIYTDRTRTVYINPNASDLSGTVVAWGQLTPASIDATDLTELTIFTDVDTEANEAIIEKMMSYLADRDHAPAGMASGKKTGLKAVHEANAESILLRVWNRVRDEQFAYQDTDNEGWFKRFDVLRGGFKEDVFRRDQWGL